MFLRLCCARAADFDMAVANAADLRAVCRREQRRLNVGPVLDPERSPCH